MDTLSREDLQEQLERRGRRAAAAQAYFRAYHLPLLGEGPAREERLGTGLASSDLHEVVRAPAEGSVDPETHELEVAHGGGDGQEKLLNLAATHVLLNRGTVHAVPSDQIAGRALAAALLRY